MKLTNISEVCSFGQKDPINLKNLWKQKNWSERAIGRLRHLFNVHCPIGSRTCEHEEWLLNLSAPSQKIDPSENENWLPVIFIKWWWPSQKWMNMVRKVIDTFAEWNHLECFLLHWLGLVRFKYSYEAFEFDKYAHGTPTKSIQWIESYAVATRVRAN